MSFKLPKGGAQGREAAGCRGWTPRSADPILQLISLSLSLKCRAILLKHVKVYQEVHSSVPKPTHQIDGLV